MVGVAGFALLLGWDEVVESRVDRPAGSDWRFVSLDEVDGAVERLQKSKDVLVTVGEGSSFFEHARGSSGEAAADAFGGVVSAPASVVETWCPKDLVSFDDGSTGALEDLIDDENVGSDASSAALYAAANDSEVFFPT